MKIISAEFMISAVSDAQYPRGDLPEIAFVGRSNVGKSSLINSLLNRKKLVKTSATPGKTQMINFFDVNHEFVCADLPGYGFAKVPKAVQKKWQTLVDSFLVPSVWTCKDFHIFLHFELFCFFFFFLHFNF